MPSRHRLKSVAHNVAASFISRNNDAGGHWAFGPLLHQALVAGEASFAIDLVSGEASPVFAREPLTGIPARYTEMFWDQVNRQGLPRERVQKATLAVQFDLSKGRMSPDAFLRTERPFSCQVRIVDDRGVAYAGTSAEWCFPLNPSSRSKPWWWFW